MAHLRSLRTHQASIVRLLAGGVFVWGDPGQIGNEFPQIEIMETVDQVRSAARFSAGMAGWTNLC